MWEFVTALLLVSGGVFAFVAGLGLVRMPDVYIRMHAATKAGTLGVGLILVAAAVHGGEAGMAVRAIAAILFLMTTAPVAAHLIGRAAYLGGVPLWRGSVADEWATEIEGKSDSPRPRDERMNS